MQLAINKAWQYQGLTYPNPAVGAVILYQDTIIALQSHQKAGTSHAEVLALLEAFENISEQKIEFDRFDSHKAHNFLQNLPKGFFAECTIYITLEPCSHVGKTPSCASLLEILKPKKVVIALKDPIAGHGGGIQKLQRANIQVEVGSLQKEAKELLEPFLIWQKRAFVLFKLAQTSNGRIGGGYLSSQESLTHVHQMREVCDTLVIGGATVRHDRPTLDCRFSKGKAPNILIYSQQKSFDQEIPLFQIQNREVEVSNNLDLLEKPSFIIIEGGEGMLKAMQTKIDWYLIYQTPKLSTNPLSYNIDKKLSFLHVDKKGIDRMIWSK